METNAGIAQTTTTKTENKPVGEKPLLNPDAPPDFISPPLPATTTQAEDETLAGQRRVNILWEIVQGTVAVMITGAVIYTQIKGIQSGVLENAFFLIVTMYFVRTNHILTGGVITKGTVPTGDR